QLMRVLGRQRRGEEVRSRLPKVLLGCRVPTVAAYSALAALLRHQGGSVKLERVVIAVLTFGALAALVSGDAALNRRYIEPLSATGDATQPPYSGAVLVGDTLYLSGDTGVASGAKALPEAAVEARVLMDSFGRRSAAA